ncbi:hypothetical protein [Paucihalobacter sp.]|uniref:hypothetical protein n=1 Tax=Paucihalobacter sp. TaxID=2850405 RepID=UPI003D161E85
MKKNLNSSFSSHEILFFIFFQLNFSQNDLLTGVIYDSYDKFPIPGVTVTNLNTKEKILSNFDGEFSIKATLGDSLFFSIEGKHEKCIQKVTTVIKDLRPLLIYAYTYNSMYNDRCKLNKEVYSLILKEVGKPKTYKDDLIECYISSGYLDIRSFLVVEDVLRNYEKSKIDIIGYPKNLFRKNKEVLVFVEKRCNEFWYLNHQNIYKTKKNGLVVPYIFLDQIIFKDLDINAKKVKFKNRVYFSKNNHNYIKDIERIPSDLYYIKKDKIFPTKGVSLIDYSKIWIKYNDYYKF